MKTVTYKEFLEFRSCWLEHKGGKERIKAYFDRFGGKMSALDILNLDDVSAEDKLWAVLCEEFISAPILQEFACVCIEYVLTLVDNPDPRCIKAIETKRASMRNEVVDEELTTTWDAARWAAMASSNAVLHAAAWYATRADWDAIGDAWRDARVATYEAQVVYLIMALEEEE